MTDSIQSDIQTSDRFPCASRFLQEFGIKFSAGGTHNSRTMMLAELEALMAAVPILMPL
jgi:hypothetical protein